jgi:hypothetical protein
MALNEAVFTPIVAETPEHNLNSGIQGGTTDYRGHISLAEYNSLLRAIKHVEGTAPYVTAASSTWTMSLSGSPWYPLLTSSSYITMSTTPKQFQISKYDSLSISTLKYRVYNGQGSTVGSITMSIDGTTVPDSQITLKYYKSGVQVYGVNGAAPVLYDYIEVTYTAKDDQGNVSPKVITGDSSIPGTTIHIVKLKLTTTDASVYDYLVTSFAFDLPIGLVYALAYKWDLSVSTTYQSSCYHLLQGTRFCSLVMGGKTSYYAWVATGAGASASQHRYEKQFGDVSHPAAIYYNFANPASQYWHGDTVNISSGTVTLLDGRYTTVNGIVSYAYSYPPKNYFRQVDLTTNTLTIDYSQPAVLWQVCPRMIYGGKAWRLYNTILIDQAGNFMSCYRDIARVNAPASYPYDVILFNKNTNLWYTGSQTSTGITVGSAIASNPPSIPGPNNGYYEYSAAEQVTSTPVGNYVATYGSVSYFINHYLRTFLFAIPFETPYRKFKLINPQGIDVSAQLQRPEGIVGTSTDISAGGQVLYDYFILKDVATTGTYGVWKLEF